MNRDEIIRALVDYGNSFDIQSKPSDKITIGANYYTAVNELTALTRLAKCRLPTTDVDQSIDDDQVIICTSEYNPMLAMIGLAKLALDNEWISDIPTAEKISATLFRYERAVRNIAERYTEEEEEDDDE